MKEVNNKMKKMLKKLQSGDTYKVCMKGVREEVWYLILRFNKTNIVNNYNGNYYEHIFDSLMILGNGAACPNFFNICQGYGANDNQFWMNGEIDKISKSKETFDYYQNLSNLTKIL